MIRNVLILLVTIVAAFYATKLLQQMNPQTISPFEMASEDLYGAAAPDVTFQNFDTEDVPLDTLKGDIVLVNAWATWCPPCIREFPDLIALAQKYPEEMTLVFLSNDLELDKAKAFAAKHKEAIEGAGNIILAFDKGRKISQNAFDIHKLPETVIIDSQGRMHRKIKGYIPWNTPDIAKYLENLK